MGKVPEYFYNQSGVIPFRVIDGVIEILLVTSRKGKRWVIPKGVIEYNLEPSESAAREAEEEAGIKGKIFNKIIGSYNYKKWGGVCTVKVYPMLVEKMLNKWEEDFRKREWFDVAIAVKNIDEKELIRVIKKLPQFIADL